MILLGLGAFSINILIDYLRFTSKVHNLAEICELLGCDSVQWLEGRPRDGWSYHEMFNGMNIFHGGRDDINVELSGQGCRMLESLSDCEFDWIGLLKYIKNQGSDMNISRLDIAGDDKEQILSFPKMIKAVEKGCYTSKARRRIWTCGNEESIVFGATSSDTRLRIYNKSLERGIAEGEKDGHWIRCEFQLRDEAADSFIANLFELDNNIGLAFGGVLLNYLRFTTKSPETCNNHYDKLITAKWWDKFVNTTMKVPNVKVGGLVYNYNTLEDFLVKQCASSLKTYVEANQGDFSKVFSMVNHAQFNIKQVQFLRTLEVTNG